MKCPIDSIGGNGRVGGGRTLHSTITHITRFTPSQLFFGMVSSGTFLGILEWEFVEDCGGSVWRFRLAIVLA